MPSITWRLCFWALMTVLIVWCFSIILIYSFSPRLSLSLQSIYFVFNEDANFVYEMKVLILSYYTFPISTTVIRKQFCFTLLVFLKCLMKVQVSFIVPLSVVCYVHPLYLLVMPDNLHITLYDFLKYKLYSLFLFYIAGYDRKKVGSWCEEGERNCLTILIFCCGKRC